MREGGVRLPGHPAVSETTIHGWAAFLFALPFAGAGVVVMLLAAGVIEADEGSLRSPRPVVAACGALFATVGLWLALHGLRGVWRRSRVRAAQARRPHEPWTWDHTWDPAGVADASGRRIGQTAFGIGLIALFCVPAHWIGFLTEERPLPFQIAAFVLDLVLLGVVAYLGYLTLRRLKFGTPRLAFAHFPYRLGGSLEVYFQAARGLDAVERLDCTLRFVEERYETRGAGRNRSQEVHSYELWADERALERAALVAGGASLRFALPDGDYATRLSDRPARYWELEVRGEAPGVDFEARFPLPVYEKA